MDAVTDILRETAPPDPSEGQLCQRANVVPAHLHDRYGRVAFVSHPRHLTQPGMALDDTLVVSTNWLLWQDCLRRGLHCVHADLGLVDWDSRVLGNDVFLRANDWMYVDGRDVTLFRGVSLGRKYIRESALVLTDFERLRQSVEGIARRFRPDELVYFDYRTYFDQLCPEDKLYAFETIADKLKCRLVDRSDPMDSSDPELPACLAVVPDGAPPRTARGRLRDALLIAFERFAAGVSRLRRVLGGRKPSVLFLAGHLTTVPLLQRFDGGPFFPLFLATWLPHKARLWSIVRFLAKGVLAIRRPLCDLGDDDRAQIREIHAQIARALSKAKADNAVPVRHLARRLTVASLCERAKLVKVAEAVMGRHAPDYVFTDGLQNPFVTTFVEAAKLHGSAVIASWHGPYYQDVKIELFGSDPRVSPLADYCFTWGGVNEEWLEAIGARTRKLRTGCPFRMLYNHNRGRPRLRGSPEHRNVLVLQYLLAPHDLISFGSDEYFVFVNIVRMLAELGYKNIRFRMHPHTESTGYY